MLSVFVKVRPLDDALTLMCCSIVLSNFRFRLDFSVGFELNAHPELFLVFGGEGQFGV